MAGERTAPAGSLSTSAKFFKGLLYNLRSAQGPGIKKGNVSAGITVHYLNLVRQAYASPLMIVQTECI